MKTLSILSTKLSAWGLHLIGRGGSMPGSIGCKVDANILSKLKFNGPVILVTGTNGKTSTANMITDLFEKAGYNVISNRKGDNLKAGIVTTLLTHAKLNGEIKANAVVLECDELNVRHIGPNINFFMNVPVTEDGALKFDDGISAPGKYVEIQAEMDLIVLISNCPQLNNPCNAYNPTQIQLIVREAEGA